ncbi:ATP-dependent zinc metalloprotease FtsH [Burkholderia pseudomallei]|uniref:ATP-dependent zinc metalloprotease FtsH n=1 Tax=Burkholderia pseudomallei TaxID=28450 RepID=UPI0005F2A15E|nr:ATP-dependent zinc metalloprotease FtsH [Burkholderia pseudomallei]KJR91440.1 cell division protein FtsH [Burkholderia pseudomallei]MDA5591950.1 ATP-dependent zinc metalloprotease FtsH [Burkholderia pseudomallei]OND61722.1 cell division protein FtsH [Burkholderia pseudomallei]OND62006.1 cell division protein FtsH [Burkholderia pseudomallei]OND71966.1 cell division protein FtsH [Burkholderia pseudomallei]
MKSETGYMGFVVVLVFMVLLALQLATLSAPATQIAYSDFRKLAAAAQLDDLEVSPTRITGVLRSASAAAALPASDAEAIKRAGTPWRFSTKRVTDERLIDTLAATGTRYRGADDDTWIGTLASWIVPIAVFVLVWNLMLRRPRGGLQDWSGVGKSKPRVYVEAKTGIDFDDIAGIDEAKAELQQIVAFLRAPARYQRLGGKIPKGVLIVGAPGTGKTLLAKAVAGEAGVPFFSTSGSSFVEMFVGVGAARVRDLFEQAQQKAPCIIFIDELDALGKVRGAGLASGNDEREQTLNQLLVEMDGFQANSGVILMAATNRPEILDPALLRPGRFDRHIAIDRPDLTGRRQILSVHVKHVKLGPDVDLGELASRTPGFVGADLANIVNEAALHAAELDKPAIDMSDFDEAIDRAMTGMERKSRVMSEREKITIAHHEAGHALIAQTRAHSDPVKKVSIIPRGIAALGYTQQVPTEDRYVLRKSELLDRLDVLLGGRVAEEIVFGDVSTGAENDLERATEMARHMVARYGMSERIGLATFGDADTQGLSPLVWQRGGERCSESTATRIEDEIQRLLAEAHDRVSRTLKERRGALERIAGYLLEHEVVDHDKLVRLVNDEPTPEPGARDPGGDAAKRSGIGAAPAKPPAEVGSAELRDPARKADNADHSVPQ